MKEVTVDQVLRLIKGLKTSSATGVDYIDTSTVKLASEQLAPIITHIINLSIKSSTFPNIWKWHKIIPLLKSPSEDPLMPKSFRPIALLPWFWSYLSGRKQSCCVDGQISEPINIPSCGVPQGSIGGPILWLVFTCDQPDVIHEHEVDGNDLQRGCVGQDGRVKVGD